MATLMTSNFKPAKVGSIQVGVLVAALKSIPETGFETFPDPAQWDELPQPFEFLSHLEREYADWKFAYNETADYPTSYTFMKTDNKGNKTPVQYDIDRPIYMFLVTLNNYFQERREMYIRLYNDLKEKYNPVENYDRMEEWSDNSSGGYTNDATTHVATDNESTVDYMPDGTPFKTTTTYADLSTETDFSPNGVAYTQKHYTTTYDDASEGRLAGYDTTEGSQKVTQNGNVENTTKGKIKTTNKGDYEKNHANTHTTNTNNTLNQHEGRVHGNVGVTYAVDGLNKEVDFRVNNILDDIILTDFVKHCLYLA